MGHEEMASGCPRGGSGWNFQEEFPHRKGGQGLEGAAQGDGGVPIPEGVLYFLYKNRY